MICEHLEMIGNYFIKGIIMRIIITLLYCLLSSSIVLAAQTKACHCFKDRSFDAANPGKVDPYILATTQNSFLALVFGIDKKEVVSSKMAGVSGNDLWIAHFAAKKGGINADIMMSARKSIGSWKAVLSQQKVELSKLGPDFKRAVSADASDETLAAIVADKMLIERLAAKPAEVKKLRINGATTKEVILSTFLSLRSGRAASEYYNTVNTGRSTWDIHLNSLAIKAEDVGLEIKKMIK